VDASVAAGDVTDEFGQKDDELVDWLALGYTHEMAGAEVGYSAKTVSRRLQKVEFEDRVWRRRRELHAQSWASALGLRAKAVKRLDGLLDSEDERVALAAVKAVFDVGGRARAEQEHEFLNDRLETVTRQMDELSEKLTTWTDEMKEREVTVTEGEARLVEWEAELADRESALVSRPVESGI
jgi:hypothetical protein